MQGGLRILPIYQVNCALLVDGSIVIWGEPNHSGDSSSVSSDLTGNICHVYGNARFFAALKLDGSVVTWGKKDVVIAGLFQQNSLATYTAWRVHFWSDE